MTLLEQVASRKNLEDAWNGIKHRGASKGIDDVTISNFKESLNAHLDSMNERLLNGTYKFKPLKGVALDKDNGGIRPLKIPAVTDRVVQKAIYLKIYDLLDAKYQLNNGASYAYIKGLGVVDAVEAIQNAYKEGYRWVVNADIEDFFGNIDQDILLEKFVYPCLPANDKTIHALIKSALATEVGNREELEKRDKLSPFIQESGIAQGSVLSPLFANVYLSSFDKAIIESECRLIRYADDIVIMCKTEEEAQKAYQTTLRILTDLKLSLHPLKPLNAPKGKYTTVERFNVLEFLGLQFEGANVYASDKKTKKMLDNLKSLPFKEKSFAENLAYIENASKTWGSTYYFTKVRKDRYRVLNEGLIRAISMVIRHYGFIKMSGKPVSKAHLRKMGFLTFERSIDIAAARVAANKAKKSSEKK